MQKDTIKQNWRSRHYSVEAAPENRLRPIHGKAAKNGGGQVRHLQGVFVARLATLRQMQQANSCYLYVVKKLQRAHLLESA